MLTPLIWSPLRMKMSEFDLRQLTFWALTAMRTGRHRCKPLGIGLRRCQEAVRSPWRLQMPQLLRSCRRTRPSRPIP